MATESADYRENRKGRFRENPRALAGNGGDDIRFEGQKFQALFPSASEGNRGRELQPEIEHTKQAVRFITRIGNKEPLSN